MAAKGDRYWTGWYGNRRWRRLRRAHLAKEPLCRHCLERGVITAANEVDHIEPHKGDRAKFWAGPFQSLCSSHHAQKTAREMGKTTKRAIGIDGAPDGW